MFNIDHAIFCFIDVFIREQHIAVPEIFGIILNKLCNDVEIKSCKNLGQKKLWNSKLDGCKRKTGNNTLTRVFEPSLCQMDVRSKHFFHALRRLW